MDIDLIQQEIDNRKKEKSQVAEQAGVLPADQFLYQLQESLKTGVPTQASTKINMVKNRSENMGVDPVTRGVVNHNAAPVNTQMMNEVAQPTYQPQNVNVNPNQNPNPNQMDPREEQFYKNLQETKQMLGGQNNAGMADAMSMYMKNQPQGQGIISSPNALNEAVQREVQSFMSQINFPKLVEDIVKSTMMELYQKEKLEGALNENKDLVKKMVVDTIIQLKKQNTSKNSSK